jgi:hypothetical protein
VDQVADGADAQAVLSGERDQVRQPGHAAVILEDLADHRRRFQTRQFGQVAAGLGVTGAHQHATLLRHQRKDVAGLHQIAGPGITGHRRLHGAGPVLR